MEPNSLAHDEIQNLESKYKQIKEHERIFEEKIRIWVNITKVSYVFAVINIISLFVVLYYSPNEIVHAQTFKDIMLLIEKYPLYFSAIIVVVILLTISSLSILISDIMKDNIKDEFELTNDEYIFIRSYEIYENIGYFLAEENIKRKIFIQNLLLKKGHEILQKINQWSFGNITFIKQIYGQPMNTFKFNYETFIIPNLVKGDEKTYKELRNIFIHISNYIIIKN